MYIKIYNSTQIETVNFPTIFMSSWKRYRITQYYVHSEIIKYLFGIQFNISKTKRDILYDAIRTQGNIMQWIIKNNRDIANNKNKLLKVYS